MFNVLKLESPDVHPQGIATHITITMSQTNGICLDDVQKLYVNVCGWGCGVGKENNIIRLQNNGYISLELVD